MFDYEFAAAMHHWNGRLATRVLVPAAIPEAALARYGMRPPRLVRYPGLKEEYYLADHAIDAGGGRTSWASTASASSPSCARRPRSPSTTAAPSTDLFAATLARLLAAPEVQTVVLPAHRRAARARSRAARRSCPSGRSTGRAWWRRPTWS